MDAILFDLIAKFDDEFDIKNGNPLFFTTDLSEYEDDEDVYIDYDEIYADGISAINERVHQVRENSTSNASKILSDIRLQINEIEDLVDDDRASIIFGFNMGWRNRQGYKVITSNNLDDHAKLIYKALTVNGDYNLNFKDTTVPGVIFVERYSHDEPMGAAFVVICNI
mgnify:CR=1 FL=1